MKSDLQSCPKTIALNNPTVISLCGVFNLKPIFYYPLPCFPLTWKISKSFWSSLNKHLQWWPHFLIASKAQNQDGSDGLGITISSHLDRDVITNKLLPQDLSFTSIHVKNSLTKLISNFGAFLYALKCAGFHALIRSRAKEPLDPFNTKKLLQSSRNMQSQGTWKL